MTAAIEPELRPEVAAALAEADAQCRRERIPMLGPDKARFLYSLVLREQPALVVECGTAVGYSGLWICAALERNDGGRLITLELDADRAEQAGRRFHSAGVSDRVEQRVGDARETIRALRGPVDFLFLDNGFEHYLPCFRGIEAQLAPAALLVADNAGIGAEQMADYLRLARESYASETHWFETDLDWVRRDAMEVTLFAGAYPAAV